MLRGSTGMAESYMLGEWDCDDLVCADHNRRATTSTGSMPSATRFHWLTGPVQKLGLANAADHPVPRQAPDRRPLRPRQHALLALPRPVDELLRRRLCRTPATRSSRPRSTRWTGSPSGSNLGPEHHLLEIGTGWGGLAVHLARKTGCRITTTTISKEQAALARERVEAAGLGDRIEVLEKDYRDLTGTYDRLVSVEMIEAVGWKDFPTYFRKCSDLLKPDGLMLLQAIVIDDDAYELEKASRSFISHFIFPGGCLPSLREIDRCLDQKTDLRTNWIDDIGLDYAQTLADWRDRFGQVTDELEALGYDLKFRRMWMLYLCVAEGGFRSRRNSNAQMTMAKPAYRSRTQPAGKAPAGTSPA